ncbi:MAG: hydantoinase B/oxoprolinase family protein [Proteobacteria bacterium]|nr:hydantoinase B/oxoprolinase family protein [Pseudomonadota bacterium]MBI3500132.1 hydantoinase B/oxoprolinase family protein [Pseudomonadota bacterium]
MTIDPVTLEVLRNRLDAIAREMQNTLVRCAFSTTLKEGGDCSCAVFSVGGEVIAQATANPTHLTSFLPAVEHTLRRYPAEAMQDSDVFAVNDPYEGGSHIPDAIVIVPIFFEGKVRAFGCALGHMLDMGGKSAGSMITDATEIFQEGLALPVCKFYDAGKPNDTLWRIIERNVRVPKAVFGDIMALIAAGRTAAAHVVAMIEHHGLGTFDALVPALLDHSERLTRAAIERIPDGVYAFADYLDNDGIDLDHRIKIAVSIEVKGSAMHFDFTGSDPQTRGPANCGPGGILAPVHFVVRALTGHDIPSNSGCFRPVRVTVPSRSVVSAERPAPVCIRYHTMKRIADTLMGALATVLPERIPAAPHGSDLCGSWGIVDPATHERFVFMDIFSGGVGASLRSDGVDQLSCDMGNGRNIPAEAVELEYPIRVWKHRKRIDSGGAGRFRGGLGVERELELLRGETSISARGDRHLTPPWGLHGGRPGARNVIVIERKDGQREIVHGRIMLQLKAGDRFIGMTAGGGGNGPPSERKIEAVLDDVADGKVSRGRAAEIYGVVIAEDMTVDHAATARRRAELAAAGQGPAIDRGKDGLGLELAAD